MAGLSAVGTAAGAGLGVSSSDNRFRTNNRARCTRLFTFATLMRSVRATSPFDRPSTS
jgi:hypothetical protein